METILSRHPRFRLLPPIHVRCRTEIGVLASEQIILYCIEEISKDKFVTNPLIKTAKLYLHFWRHKSHVYNTLLARRTPHATRKTESLQVGNAPDRRIISTGISLFIQYSRVEVSLRFDEFEFWRFGGHFAHSAFKRIIGFIIFMPCNFLAFFHMVGRATGIA